MPRKLVALRVRTYEVVSEAVERGVICGMRRAFKHADKRPAEDTMDLIAERVLSAVMDELCEVVNFDA